jgi:hypothetical protein
MFARVCGDEGTPGYGSPPFRGGRDPLGPFSSMFLISNDHVSDSTQFRICLLNNFLPSLNTRKDHCILANRKPEAHLEIPLVGAVFVQKLHGIQEAW